MGGVGRIFDSVMVARNVLMAFGNETLCRPWCIGAIVAAYRRGIPMSTTIFTNVTPEETMCVTITDSGIIVRVEHQSFFNVLSVNGAVMSEGGKIPLIDEGVIRTINKLVMVGTSALAGVVWIDGGYGNTGVTITSAGVDCNYYTHPISDQSLQRYPATLKEPETVWQVWRVLRLHHVGHLAPFDYCTHSEVCQSGLALER